MTEVMTERTSIVPGLVSTIIPVYNRKDLLLDAVQSVLDQTYQSFEIIVVDDGSNDGTAEFVDELVDAHPEVRCIHVANGGAGRAREAGRKLARGEFIQYLDSDDVLLPCKFAVQVDALRSRQDCDIAYGYMRLVDPKGQVIQAPSQWTGRSIETLFPALLVDRWWGTHTPLYRRALLDRVGPWSEMRRGEDYEYEARIGALNPKLVQCRQFVCDDRQHEGDRLTGKFDTLFYECEPQLLEAVFRGAMAAGVDCSCREMRHFSRHAFLIARMTGAKGFPRAAAKCFGLAVQAASQSASPARDLKIYGVAAKVLGWRVPGVVSCAMDRVAKRRVGKHTLPRSRSRSESWDMA